MFVLVSTIVLMLSWFPGRSESLSDELF